MKVQIPYLGDGIGSATVLSVFVSVGDRVEKDQSILELETDKAVAPVPSSATGVVEQILVKSGDTVSSGTAVLILQSNQSNTLVSSPKETEAPVVSEYQTATPKQSPAPLRTSSAFPVAASPSLRKLALQIGLDLNRINGSGRGGRIELKDVKTYIHTLQSLTEVPPYPAPEKPVVKQPAFDFAKLGSVERKPLSSLRKKIGEKMAASWKGVPHVTQCDEADITELMQLRKKLSQDYEKKGAKLTVTAFAIKAVIQALQKFPTFNSSFDEASGELILKSYYHIGIAVDTEAGLIVPVIRNADQKTLLDLSLELSSLAKKARSRALTLDDLQGGSFTLSNLGGLGAGLFTPIVNIPEVAILGLSKASLKPVVKNNVIDMRWVMPVSLSYDHRIIDGADGARFTREIVTSLENIKE